MKYNFQALISILFILSSTSSVSSQTWFQEGDYWVYRYSDGSSGTDGYCEMTVEGDTLIDNIEAKKLLVKCKTFSQANNTSYEYQFFKYAYEENKKLFLANNQNEFGEAMDFSDEVDSIYNYNRNFFDEIADEIGCEEYVEFQIDSVRNFILDDESLNIKYTSLNDPYYDYTYYIKFYERIGALNGLILAPQIPCYLDGSGSYRLCQFKSSTDSLAFLNQDCFAIISSIKDRLFANLSISPNPTNSSISIDYNQIPQEVSVFDLQGKLLIKEEHVNLIEVDHLKAGVYLMKIEVENRNEVKKFIKL